MTDTRKCNAMWTVVEYNNSEYTIKAADLAEFERQDAIKNLAIEQGDEVGAIEANHYQHMMVYGVFYDYVPETIK